MNWSISIATFLIGAALSATASAQLNTVADSHTMDMKDATYTGCLSAGNAVGTFTLTHLTTPAHLRLEIMKKGTPTKAAPVAATLSLTSSLVDLSMHLGREVSVTGSPAQAEMNRTTKGTNIMSDATPSFNVKSVKLTAASCP
jgi:hypothetical protein